MKSVHVLLVEDNEGDIVLTIEALDERKIINKISIVKDGKQALDFLEKKPPYEAEDLPDIILLDVNLPKKNGHEVLEHIKNSPSLKHIPIIMLTTSSLEKDINLSYENHANCYITKPVEVDDFLRVVNKIENFWINIVQLPTK
ncbi:MAG: response regulator [Flavobacteriales bacterium]